MSRQANCHYSGRIRYHHREAWLRSTWSYEVFHSRSMSGHQSRNQSRQCQFEICRDWPSRKLHHRRTFPQREAGREESARYLRFSWLTTDHRTEFAAFSATAAIAAILGHSLALSIYGGPDAVPSIRDASIASRPWQKCYAVSLASDRYCREANGHLPRGIARVDEPAMAVRDTVKLVRSVKPDLTDVRPRFTSPAV